jgi:vitamin B12 transporter
LILSSRADVTLSGILVGERFNSSNSTTPLPAYGRLDLSGRYFLTPATEIYARIENLTNTDYEDPAGYNAPGLSAYVGLKWVR